jgi:hypothetical protein
MFCIEENIAPVQAAALRLSKVYHVDYSDRGAVLEKIRELVLILRAIKGKQKLLNV